MFGRRKHHYQYGSIISPNKGRGRVSRRYSTYGGYDLGKERRRKSILKVAGIIIAVVAIALPLNFSRLRLAMKGYSISEQSAILKLGKSNVTEVLKEDKMDHITDWIGLSEHVSYYNEYEDYLSLHKKTKLTTVISVIDEVYDNQLSALNDLGYDQEAVWELLKTQDANDLSSLIKNEIKYETVKKYIGIQEFACEDVADYEKLYKKKKSATYAVLATAYPAIISSNNSKEAYTIKNPKSLTALVKKGFYLPNDYEAPDLVSPDDYKITISPDCDEPKLRKEAMESLDEMYAAAKKENLILVINSAYRSYKAQKETYKRFEKMYGGIYAAEHVALPGASDHQTGLGVDLTSQSVVKGKKLVFSDTQEYVWCKTHCYEYGFILRYPVNTSDITGISSEAWHFRYVGKDVAKKIHDNNWTLEEYCLYEGVLPELEKRS